MRRQTDRHEALAHLVHKFYEPPQMGKNIISPKGILCHAQRICSCSGDPEFDKNKISVINSALNSMLVYASEVSRSDSFYLRTDKCKSCRWEFYYCIPSMHHRITDNFYLHTYEAEEKEGTSC